MSTARRDIPPDVCEHVAEIRRCDARRRCRPRINGTSTTSTLAKARPDAENMVGVFAAFTGLAADVLDIQELRDGQLIVDGEGFVAPGHGLRHICLFRPADGLRISGGLLLSCAPNIQPGFGGADALLDFRHSLLRVATVLVAIMPAPHRKALRELSNRVLDGGRAPADRMLARIETCADLDHVHRRRLAWGYANGSWTPADLPRSRR